MTNDTDKTEFVFHTVENNRSEETTVELPEFIATTSLVLCSLILAIGLLGNSLVIIVVLSNKLLRSSTNFFLLNLSVADLLVLVTSTPTSLVEIAIGTDAWILGKAMCFLVPFVELSVSHTSVLTILAITVERYYAICLPLQAGLVWTKSKACLTCIIAWLFAFGLTAPILAMIEYTPDETSPVCLTQVDYPWSKFYFIFIITVFFFIPFLILVLLYRHIARHLVPPAHNANDSDDQVVAESSAVIRSRRQVVGMLFAVVVIFFACILPFKLLTLWIVASPIDIMDVINEETYFTLLYFSRVMFYINSAINPILYNVMSSKFRDGFRRIFKRCRRGGAGHGYYHNSTFYTGTQTIRGDHIHTSSSPRSTAVTRGHGSSFFERMSTGSVFGRSNTRRQAERTISYGGGTSMNELHQKLGKSNSARLNNDAISFKNSSAIGGGSSSIFINGIAKDEPSCSQERTSKRRSSSRYSHHSQKHSEAPSSTNSNASIVFIEERKILLIPTSSANPSPATSSGPSPTSGSTAPEFRCESYSRKQQQFVSNPMFDEHEEDDQAQT